MIVSILYSKNMNPEAELPKGPLQRSEINVGGSIYTQSA